MQRADPRSVRRGCALAPSAVATATLAALLPTLLSLLTLGCGQREPAQPQNVILILVDTLRADHLSSYGYERNTSPKLDAFASDNIRFARVRSQSACTSPSVSSLLTSRSPLALMDQPQGHLGIPRQMPSLAEILKGFGYWTIAISASPIVRKNPSEANRFGEFDRGFDVFDEECLMKDARCINRKALDTLDSITPPFFLYLHYMDVHAPYAPPADFERPFSRPYEGHAMVQAGRPQQFQQVARNQGFAIEPSAVAHFVDRYDDEIAFFDAELGKLLEALAGRGLMDRSIIVIASDHGDAFLEQGYLGHCRVPLFEGMITTPLIMAIPGVDRRGPVTVDAQNLDIVPTLIDYLGRGPGSSESGSELDERDEFEFEGRSLRPAIERDEPGGGFSFAVQGVQLAVSDRNYTLTYDLDTQATRIFDRAKDPEHKMDLTPGESESKRALLLQIELQLNAAGDGVASRARRLEDELRALGYLLEPADGPPPSLAKEPAQKPAGKP